jgi:hypothetical protein
MEDENKNFGNLFNTIELLNEDHLELILTTMDNEHSLYYLIEAVKSAHRKGAFSIGETEVISKSIRTLLK